MNRCVDWIGLAHQKRKHDEVVEYPPLRLDCLFSLYSILSRVYLYYFQYCTIPKVPDEHTGAVVDLLSRRKGEMINMTPIESGGDTQMSNIEYLVPTRGMIGLRNSMLTATRGTAVMDTLFHSYKPFAGELDTMT